MTDQVFRFVSVRPPVLQPPDRVGAVVLLQHGDSELAEVLANARKPGGAGEMVAIAHRFINSDEFVGSRGALDPAYSAFADAVHQLAARGFAAAAGEATQKIFDSAPRDLVKKEAFKSAVARVADSAVAATIDAETPTRSRTLLVRLARSLWLIRALADGENPSHSDFHAASLVLPAGILPLPSPMREASSRPEESAEDRRSRVERASKDLASTRGAVDELLEALERTGAEPVADAGAGGGVGFALSATATAALTQDTRNSLEAVRLDGSTVDVAKAVGLLNRRAIDLARRLNAEASSPNAMVRLGNRFVPVDVFDAPLTISPGDASSNPGIPGLCPPQAASARPEGVTVPSGHGEMGLPSVADLMVLEQTRLRYELGDIAHIENVLLKERRSRKFRTTKTTETEELVETETTESKEQDLSSTERFELQTEAETVVSQEASRQAGLTISASYGPSVDATANYNVATATSREQSNKAAATYAREVTTKAVERVQQRALKRRLLRTVNEVEEVNFHGFDNREGQTDIVGVYRFVDKICRAQVVNYGKRLIIEFLIPEPAAFLRFAATRRPVDETFPVRPDPPGCCLPDGVSFAPLTPTDLNRDNYVYWASHYGAEDVTPAPPQFVIASDAKKSPEQMPLAGSKKISNELIDVAIPDGYLCRSAFVNVYGETQSQVGEVHVVVQVQNKQKVYTDPSSDEAIWALHTDPTPALAVSLNSSGFHNYEMLVTVFCTLSREAYEAWQLKTFASIMGAYSDTKSRYDQALAEARLQAEDGSVRGGTNPLANRERERTELKKNCIALLTGQHFDAFDAVARNVAPFGYPEVDFAEAKAEAAWVRAFEQSFEWNNMTYVLYPYYWNTKAEWPALAQLSDDDPQYASFLQAGAARVQVPVRPGFEEVIVTYASTGRLWTAEGALVSGGAGDDGDEASTHLSILDELRSQTGNNDEAGLGEVSVTKGSNAVAGDGTNFSDGDERRRITIGGVVYLIEGVTDESHITLAEPYAGATGTGLGYALGGVLVGEPWEVRLPTALVKLDSSITIG